MTYRLDITKQAQHDLAFHRKSGNKSTLNKLNKILNELIIHPFTGDGKPEPLKHKLSGKWFRRINREHRVVYKVF
jgi:toxin YoeB